MGAKLQKGENILLNNNDAILNDIIVGVGWHLRNNALDLDVSAFMLNENGKVRNDEDFIFYNQTKSSNSCIMLDNSPKLDSNSRCFYVQLSKIPTEITKIIFVITIDPIGKNEHNFSTVEKAYIKILENTPSEQEFIRYDIEDASQEVALMAGEIYRHKNNWKFRAVGQGYSDGLSVMTSNFGVNINNDSVPSEGETEETISLRKKRRSPKQVFSEKATLLKEGLNIFLPQIQSAVDKKINESNTRMILDKIFMDVFGYDIEEIKAEQKIQGRRADYVLTVEGIDAVVVEAKKAGMPLRAKQIFQATSYGAYSGIRWALLTNLITWQVYHISTQDKVEANMVFSIDLLPDIRQEEAEILALISRYGMQRKGLLEKKCNEVRALSHENVIRAIITEDVINKIRLIIKRDTGCNIDNEQIQNVVEEILQVS